MRGQQKGFAALEIIIILIVVGVIVAVGLSVVSKKSGNPISSLINPTESSDKDEPPKLKNIGFNLDYYDPKSKQLSYYEIIELEQGQYFDILPQEHIIVSTLESVKMPRDLMAILFPRSSIIDAGYEGQLIIPVTNNIHQTIRLYPGERFCQVIFEELTNGKEKILQSRFHKQDIIKGFVAEKSQSEKTLIRKGDIKKLKDRYGI